MAEVLYHIVSWCINRAIDHGSVSLEDQCGILLPYAGGKILLGRMYTDTF